MKEEKIRVLIVDDHAVVRGGLRLFLLAFDDLKLVGEASNGKEAVLLCQEKKPDVVLMDLVMPEMNGIEAIRSIREKMPQIEIVALTSFPEENLVQDSLEAGAISYLMKNASANELASAIRAAHVGQSILAPEATKALLHKSREPYLWGLLTDREKEVLKLLVLGKSNTNIADKLSISLSTVKFHVAKIYQKLGVNNRAEALSFAMQHRIVEMDNFLDD